MRIIFFCLYYTRGNSDAALLVTRSRKDTFATNIAVFLRAHTDVTSDIYKSVALSEKTSANNLRIQTRFLCSTFTPYQNYYLNDAALPSQIISIVFLIKAPFQTLRLVRMLCPHEGSERSPLL